MEEKRMYCKNCGGQIDDNSTFCKHCGSALSKDTREGMPYQNGNMPYQTAGMQGMTQNGYQQNPMGAAAYPNGQGMVNKINIAAIISSALLAAAMFLPYISIESFITVSKSLIEGDGVFFMIIAALGIIGALVKKNKIVIAAGILACVLCVAEIVILTQNEYSELYTKGAGYYMMIIASVLLLISGFIKRK